MSRRKPMLAVVLVMMATAPEVSAQGAVNMARVSQAVNSALVLQTNGRFTEAAAALEQTLNTCAEQTCRRLVLYSLGYLFQVEARRNPANQTQLLQTAADRYRDLLTAEPQHGQATYNLALVYRDMGAHEWQEQFLRDAPRADPGRRAEYETLLGDYYRDRQLWDRALDAYRRATVSNPDDAAPRSGMLEVFRALAPARNADLLVLAREWAARFPDLTADAYALIVRSATGTDTSPDDVTERALLGWVSNLARHRRIDAAALRDLPAGWKAADDLRRYVESPYTLPASGEWWMANDERRKTLVEVALAIGQIKLAEGRPDRTEACWMVARQMLPPIYKPILDLKRELAMLWFRRPDLDPGGRKFNAMEQELFLEKAGVLGSGDLEAAQRYHTALGLIYFEQKNWRSARRGWNGIDQLTWALEKAAQRDRQLGFYQPLPELKSMLAQGLAETGQRTAATAMQRRAAEAFLDTDNLEDAAAASARVATGAARPFALLIGHRQALDSLINAAATGPTSFCERPRLERALAAAGAVTRGFIGRQRFKMLADCSRMGPNEQRASYAAEAFMLAQQDSITLTSIADVLRFERAGTAVLGAVGMRQEPTHVDFDERADSSALRVALPTETRVGRIHVPREAAIAGAIVRLVGPQRVPLRLNVNQGSVSIDAPAGAISPALLQQIRGVRGVSAVQLTRGQ